VPEVDGAGDQPVWLALGRAYDAPSIARLPLLGCACGLVVCVSGVGHLAAAARSQRAAEDELFTGLDHNQREQLRQLLLSLQANLHPGQAPRCSPPAADHC
jgi:hypothetical protein